MSQTAIDTDIDTQGAKQNLSWTSDMLDGQAINADDYSQDYEKNARSSQVEQNLAWAREMYADPDPAVEQINNKVLPPVKEPKSTTFSTAVRNVADVPLSVGHGAIAGINEAIGLVEDLGKELETFLPDWMAQRPYLNFEETWGPGLPSLELRPTSEEGLARAPEVFNDPNTPLGGVVSKISQFITGFATGGKALKGIQATTTAGRVAKAAAQGGISDFAFFDAQENRLSNLIQEVPALQNPVSEYLAARPEDGDFEGRFKNAIEGLGLGVATEAFITSVKAIRAWRLSQSAGMDAGEEALAKVAGQETPPAVLETLGEADGPLLMSSPPVAGSAANAGRNAQIDALEMSGYSVNKDVFDAPVALDNKQRFGMTRDALEAEGSFGERWTKIDTDPAAWPSAPKGKGLTGAIAHTWRELGKQIYNTLKGKYQVGATGDTIIVGGEGARHMFGQRQTPEAIMAVEHLPELIQKAFKTGEYNPKPSKAKTPDTRPTSIFHSAAVIDGTPYDVALVTKNLAHGQQELLFYDMRAREKAVNSSVMEKQVPEAHGSTPAQESAGSHVTPEIPVNSPGMPHADLTDIKLSDFFGDVKDIVDTPFTREAPEGVFINFARINSPDDIKRVMQESANKYKREMDAASRGKRSFQETTLSAEQEDAWQVLASRRVGEPLNAEQSLAARNLWASTTEKLAETAKLATGSPTPENLFAFRKMLEIQNAVQLEVKAARTETARALGSWRIPAGPREYQLREISELVERMPGGRKSTEQLAQYVSRLSEAGLVREMDELVSKSNWAIARESIQEAWVMALLSGPKTHLVNMLSNTTVALQEVFERGVAARIGRILGDDTGVQLGEAMALLNGQLGAVKDGLRLAGKAFADNQGGAWGGKIDLPHNPGISAENWGIAKNTAWGKTVDVIGQVVRVPGRALMAEDEFFKTVGYRSQMNALAYREATREAAAGKIGKEQVKSRMAEILENPPDSIKVASIDHAAYTTFTNAPGQFAQKWLKITQDIPALKFITPFVKTPANIFNYAVAQRSPFAPLFRSFREDIAAGGARQQLALARVTTGSTIMLAAAGLAFNGLITGSGPPNAAQKQTLMRTGWQPNSVKIDGRYYSFSRMDPIGILFGVAADLAEIVNHVDQEDKEVDADEAAVYFAASVAGNVMSKSYMRGLSDIVEALANPKMRSQNFAQRFAGSFIPAGVAEITRYNDPYMLEVNGMLDAMKARIPGLSQDLPVRRDLWGRPIEYRSGLGAFYDAVSPIASRRENPEPVDNELLRLEAYIASPKRSVSFDGVMVDLTRYGDAYSRFSELAGNGLKHPAWGVGCMDFLNDVVTGKSPMSDIYKIRSDGPEGGKADFIKSTVYEYREMAREQLLREYPELRSYVEMKKIEQPGKWNF